MPKNMSEFLAMMDERLWFRMTVCFLPPLVLVKLFGNAESGALMNNVTTAILLIFVALYVFWPRLREWSKPAVDVGANDESMESEGDPAASASAGNTEVAAETQLEMLAELRALCQETERESDRLIAMEAAVNPHLSYAEATHYALTRKKMLLPK